MKGRIEDYADESEGIEAVDEELLQRLAELILDDGQAPAVDEWDEPTFPDVTVRLTAAEFAQLVDSDRG